MDQCKECELLHLILGDVFEEIGCGCEKCVCYRCMHKHNCNGQCGGVNSAKG